MIIRKAVREDAKLIFDFINKLAVYEKMEQDVTGNVSLIEKWVFDEKRAEVIFITENNKEVGFALYFYNFSTFVTKPGIYLEDLYILPEYRNKGYGKQVFQYLIDKAKLEECGRIEWTCLNWNTPSIKFYESLGAIGMNEWTTYRLSDKIIMEKSTV